MAGLVTSRFLGLSLVEGELPPQAVYGFSTLVVTWTFVAAALLIAVPLASAMFAVRPSRSVNATAIGMAAVGIILLPDELGRAFGIPILAGAAAMAVGGRLLMLEAAANGVDSAAGADAQRSGHAPTWVFDTVDLGNDETPDPSAASAAGLDSATRDHLEAAPSRRKSARKGAAKPAAEMTCQWCSALVPVDATTCPTCQAPLNEPEIGSMAIPGVTEVSPALRAYAQQAKSGKKRANILKVMFSDTPVPQTIDAPPPSDAAALRPPSPELRAEMARLDAEIAAGGADSDGMDHSDAAAGPPEAAPEGPPEART